MIILGIETSCDETAVAVLDCSGDLNAPILTVLSSVVSSQIKLHEQWGGVVPMLAKREHARNLVPVLEQAIREANLWHERSAPLQPTTYDLRPILSRDPDLIAPLKELLEKIEKPQIDAIAVTNGPGLEPALWVGVSFAKALALAWNIPLYPTNHMKGHVLAGLLQDRIHTSDSRTPKIQFPILALLVSGGHTELDLFHSWTECKTVGQTRDDAAGEAFDKVARLLGLPYPGGPEIFGKAKIAEERRLDAEKRGEKYVSTIPKLPRPMINSKDLDFSFAGLKTSVRYLVEKIGEPSVEQINDIAREFQNAVIEVLVTKTKSALEQTQAKSFVLGGGVAANGMLKSELKSMLDAEFPDVGQVIPEPKLTTDNAAMIAAAGYIAIVSGSKPETEFKAQGGLKIST